MRTSECRTLCKWSPKAEESATLVVDWTASVDLLPSVFSRVVLADTPGMSAEVALLEDISRVTNEGSKPVAACGCNSQGEYDISRGTCLSRGGKNSISGQIDLP